MPTACHCAHLETISHWQRLTEASPGDVARSTNLCDFPATVLTSGTIPGKKHAFSARLQDCTYIIMKRRMHAYICRLKLMSDTQSRSPVQQQYLCCKHSFLGQCELGAPAAQRSRSGFRLGRVVAPHEDELDVSFLQVATAGLHRE